MSSEKCAIHAGRSHQNRANRRPLDLTLYKLPESSTGVGAKKCAYCAYLLGIEDTIKAVEKALEIGQFPKGRGGAIHNRRLMEEALKSSFQLGSNEEGYETYLDEFVDRHFSKMGDDKRQEWIDEHK